MKFFFLVGLSASLFASYGIAGTMGDVRTYPFALSSTVMSASIGADFANRAKGQTLNLLPPF